MTGPVVTIENVVIAIAYIAIAWLIASRLLRSRQLGSNRLGAATATIFLTGGIHHGGLAIGATWGWPSAVWDFAAAGVALYYLSLRGNYAGALQGAQLFDDYKVRERQALELHDNVVQELLVAKRLLEVRDLEHGEAAVDRTLDSATAMISEMLGESPDLQPGDLRRAIPS